MLPRYYRFKMTMVPLLIFLLIFNNLQLQFRCISTTYPQLIHRVIHRVIHRLKIVSQMCVNSVCLPVCLCESL